MPSEIYSVKYPVQKIPVKFPNSKIASQVSSFKIEKKKYTTNIDSRNFLTVFEYAFGGNWVIWDYHHGLVFFTGLYKICNEGEKWDYLKVIDKYSLNNMSSVKRIRGGYLKIQGTWIPYKLAYEISTRFCYKYRYQLTPLFGDKFPQDCISPHTEKFKNFDKLKISQSVQLPPPGSMKRRFSLSIENSSHSNKRVEKKPRSKSFTSGDFNEEDDIAELKELLNASKQLHNFNNRSRTPKDDMFNYAGFLWKFSNNDKNLNVLGKSDPSKDITKLKPKTTTIIVSGINKPIVPVTSPKKEHGLKLYPDYSSISPALGDQSPLCRSLNDNCSVITASGNLSENKNYTYDSKIETVSRLNTPPVTEKRLSIDRKISNTTMATRIDNAITMENEDMSIPNELDGIETILFAAASRLDDPNFSMLPPLLIDSKESCIEEDDLESVDELEMESLHIVKRDENGILTIGTVGENSKRKNVLVDW